MCCEVVYSFMVICRLLGSVCLIIIQRMFAKQFVVALGVFLLGEGFIPAQEDLPGVDPIPQNPKAFLEKDYRAEERTWAERCLLKPTQERWSGQPWATEADSLVQEAFALRELEGAQVTQHLQSLAPRFKTLLEKGVDDPLLLCLGAQALFDERLNWRDAKDVRKRVDR